MTDSTPLTTAALIAVVIAFAGTALILIQKNTNAYPAVANIFFIGLAAYLWSFAGSAIYQQVKCKKVNVGSTALSSLLLFGVASGITGVLSLESVPIKYWLFGQFPRTDPSTGKPFTEETREYQEDMRPIESDDDLNARIWGSDRYKVQTFSNLVTAVFPEFMVPVYWLFWLTLIPMYTLLKTQAVC